MSTIIRILLVMAVLALAGGCEKGKWWFGKKDPDRPPDVMTKEGMTHFKKKNYDDAIETFEKVKDRYPYSEEALLAQIKLADAYFYKKKFDEALGAYKEFEKLHPTNKAVPYCVFRQGLCYYRQRSTIDRDQTYTIKALEEFKRLKQKFPDCEYIPKAEGYMAQCRRDLGEQEFYVAEFYYRTKRYQAAIDRYQIVLQDYPEMADKQAQSRSRIEECQRLLEAEKQPEGFLSKIYHLFDARW